jgi:hypothetical protein
MDKTNDNYYIANEELLLRDFDQDAKYWQRIIAQKKDGEIAKIGIWQARQIFIELLPVLPKIGGEDNPFISELIRSVRYLALYKSMKAFGWTAMGVGEVVFEAIFLFGEEQGFPAIPPASDLTEEFEQEMVAIADRSLERVYPGDYVYKFVQGDGIEFDYGFDFIECASYKFYADQNVVGFLPYFCYSDFAMSKIGGHGLTRMMTLSEGYSMCNHRIMQGRATKAEWPPKFASTQ